MYFIPQKHVCPKGHEQMGTGHVQTSDLSSYASGKPYCWRCYLAWLGDTFPTTPASEGQG